MEALTEERATWADVFAAIGTLIREMVKLPVTIVGVLLAPLPLPDQEPEPRRKRRRRR